jgi:hypothetical protein
VKRCLKKIFRKSVNGLLILTCIILKLSLYYTAEKFGFMYSQKRNSAASVQFPLSCVCERSLYSHVRPTYFSAAELGLGTEFRSEKIPRNRLGTVSVILRKKVLIPGHSKFRGRANSEARNGTERNSAEKLGHETVAK